MNLKPLRGLALVMTLGSGLAAGPALADDARHSRSFEHLSERVLCTHVLNGELFSRTELFFGHNRPGGTVSEQEFQDFLDKSVTPRFPDGLTVVDGKGQFRGASASVPEKEDAKILILLYPFAPKTSALVDEIRTDYKTQFEQQSVLRVDEQSCVSF